jgi:hypothetical protein
VVMGIKNRALSYDVRASHPFRTELEAPRRVRVQQMGGKIRVSRQRLPRPSC